MEFKGNLKSVLSTELASYLADTGSANAYAVAIRPAIAAYTTGLKITFQAANACTGPSTLAVNGLAAKTILKNVTDQLDAGDIFVNSIITVIYDGTNFQLLPSIQPMGKILVTYNAHLEACAAPIVTKSGTITGAVGIGSSLFLHRIEVPARMNLTEVDAAMSIGFPATNQGAGTMSRYFALYTFGNNTSLASVMSFSSSSVWSTGTSTTAGATSLTQFQGGWSTPLIVPMTFAASTLGRGEYVVGQLFNFAQASSTWTLNLYGEQGVNTFLASAATNLTSASLAAISNAGTIASGFFRFTSASSTSYTTANAGSASNVSNAITASQIAVFSTAPSTLGAITNVALGALSSSTVAQIALPVFGYIGTGSTTSNFPSIFLNGIMSTGAVPASIALTSAAVTYSGSTAFMQPWCQLVGS